jgi:alpha-tubulin suppressor-like RCC1 family protein
MRFASLPVSGGLLNAAACASQLRWRSALLVIDVLVSAVLVTACDLGTGPKAATWTGLTAGYTHSCGMRSNGAAYCWGDNVNGGLGDGSTTQRVTPVAVAGGLTFASLTAGWYHTCGLTSSGAAYCWGRNADGQLGDGSTDSSAGYQRLTPVAVVGGLRFASLTAGGEHTCGVTTGGAAYCWGHDNAGQLGDSSTDSSTGYHRSAPVAVAGGLTFANLAAGGYHTCGATSSGAAYCWGNDFFGQLGDGQATQAVCFTLRQPLTGQCSTTPVAVAGGLTFASVTAGVYHTCGVTTGGAAYCWGFDGYGQLGDGVPYFSSIRPVPLAVAGGLTFTNVTAEWAHTCGLRSNGAAYCWGDNGTGELGDNSTTQRLSPVAVAGGLTFGSLTTGQMHTCGVTTAGAAYCWGDNAYGELGDGSTIQRLTPVAVVSP